MQLSGGLGKAVKKLKKDFCPYCRNFCKHKECPLFEMCAVSLFSLKKKKPLHFTAESVK